MLAIQLFIFTYFWLLIMEERPNCAKCCCYCVPERNVMYSRTNLKTFWKNLLPLTPPPPFTTVRTSDITGVQAVFYI
jgi:hypothetical protein